MPIRILDEEIAVIEEVFCRVNQDIKTAFSYWTSFSSESRIQQSEIRLFGDLEKDLSDKMFWTGRINDTTSRFAMFWDESTIAPILYGVLGGDIEGVRKRILSSRKELTNIELGILFDPILQCFINPINNQFSNFNPGNHLLLDQMSFRLNDASGLFHGNEFCYVKTFHYFWISGQNESIASKCHFVLPQTFIRKYNWRSKNAKF